MAPLSAAHEALVRLIWYSVHVAVFCLRWNQWIGGLENVHTPYARFQPLRRARFRWGIWKVCTFWGGMHVL